MQALDRARPPACHFDKDRATCMPPASPTVSYHQVCPPAHPHPPYTLTCPAGCWSFWCRNARCFWREGTQDRVPHPAPPGKRGWVKLLPSTGEGRGGSTVAAPLAWMDAREPYVAAGQSSPCSHMLGSKRHAGRWVLAHLLAMSVPADPACRQVGGQRPALAALGDLAVARSRSGLNRATSQTMHNNAGACCTHKPATRPVKGGAQCMQLLRTRMVKSLLSEAPRNETTVAGRSNPIR